MSAGKSNTQANRLPKHHRPVTSLIYKALCSGGTWRTVFGMERPDDLCTKVMLALIHLSEETGVPWPSFSLNKTAAQAFYRKAVRHLGDGADNSPAVRELLCYASEYARMKDALERGVRSRTRLEVESMEWPEYIPG